MIKIIDVIVINEVIVVISMFFRNGLNLILDIWELSNRKGLLQKIYLKNNIVR